MTAQHITFASYGNDSIALIQWCADRGMKDVCALYSDTGWAAPWWAERVERCEAWVRSLGYRAERTSSIGMEALVKGKKGWPREGMQFCTQQLKLDPALAWLEENDPLGYAICLVGIRREESANRRSFPEWVEYSAAHGERPLWAPMVNIKEAERDALIVRAGFDVLPHRSRECWPCINLNRAGLRELDEEALTRVERIETEMGVNSKGNQRTMYRPYRHMGATGIREIFRWAQSERGKFDLEEAPSGNCDSGMCGL